MENNKTKRVSLYTKSSNNGRCIDNRTTISIEDLFPNIFEKGLISDNETLEDLLEKSQQGDAGAREMLIEGNMRFIAAASKPYIGLGLIPEELLEEGKVGLSQAIDEYHKSCRLKFIPFALIYIKQSILNALKERGTEEGVALATEEERKLKSKIYIRQYSREEEQNEAMICSLYDNNEKK